MVQELLEPLYAVPKDQSMQMYIHPGILIVTPHASHQEQAKTHLNNHREQRQIQF